jgi:hypothetical protein
MVKIEYDTTWQDEPSRPNLEALNVTLSKQFPSHKVRVFIGDAPMPYTSTTIGLNDKRITTMFSEIKNRIPMFSSCSYEMDLFFAYSKFIQEQLDQDEEVESYDAARKELEFLGNRTRKVFDYSKEVTPEELGYIKTAVSFFHYRDGKQHQDDSVGTIEITPGQLRELIAYTLINKGRRK